MCYRGKKTDSMCYHGKKTDSMRYHGKKTACAITEERQIVCVIMEKKQHVLSWKNTFVVPLFYKIVRRFYVGHISHRKSSLPDSIQKCADF